MQPGKTAEHTARILIVDDETRIAELVTWYLRRRGHEAVQVASFREARELLPTMRPDLLLSDIELGEENAREELPRLHAEGLLPPTLVVSGYLDPRTVAQLQELPNVLDVLAKPFEFDALDACVQDLLARARARPAGSGAGGGSSARAGGGSSAGAGGGSSAGAGAGSSAGAGAGSSAGAGAGSAVPAAAEEAPRGSVASGVSGNGGHASVSSQRGDSLAARATTPNGRGAAAGSALEVDTGAGPGTEPAGEDEDGWIEILPVASVSPGRADREH